MSFREVRSLFLLKLDNDFVFRKKRVKILPETGLTFDPSKLSFDNFVLLINGGDTNHFESGSANGSRFLGVEIRYDLPIKNYFFSSKDILKISALIKQS